MDFERVSSTITRPRSLNVESTATAESKLEKVDEAVLDTPHLNKVAATKDSEEDITHRTSLYTNKQEYRNIAGGLSVDDTLKLDSITCEQNRLQNGINQDRNVSLDPLDDFFDDEDNDDPALNQEDKAQPPNELEIESELFKTPAHPQLTKHEYSNAKKGPLKAGQEGYVSEFYNHSRLHHLSMWKAELKKFATMIHKKRGSASKKGSAMTSSSRWVVHIDLDSFFVSVALKKQPDLKGKPIAVCHAGRGGEGKQ